MLFSLLYFGFHKENDKEARKLINQSAKADVVCFPLAANQVPCEGWTLFLLFKYQITMSQISIFLFFWRKVHWQLTLLIYKRQTWACYHHVQNPLFLLSWGKKQSLWTSLQRHEWSHSRWPPRSHLVTPSFSLFTLSRCASPMICAFWKSRPANDKGLVDETSPETAIAMLETKTLRPHPELLTQNLHFNKISL